jgi:CubicO group peptidase (beta-lactamase class C family)
MNDTTVETNVYASQTNRAVGHEVGYASVPLRTPLIPSGGVYTSARDMAMYCLFHLRRGKMDGKTVLTEELWNEMHGFALGGDYSLGVIRTELRYGSSTLRFRCSRRRLHRGYPCLASTVCLARLSDCRR